MSSLNNGKNGMAYEAEIRELYEEYLSLRECFDASVKKANISDDILERVFYFRAAAEYARKMNEVAEKRYGYIKRKFPSKPISLIEYIQKKEDA